MSFFLIMLLLYHPFRVKKKRYDWAKIISPLSGLMTITPKG